MDDSLITLSDYGEPTIDRNSKTVINLFTIASKDITYLGAPVTFYGAISDTESVLMEIIDDPEKANIDLDRSFFGSKFGNGRDEYRQMIWCLAWSICRMSTVPKKALNTFFNDIFRRIGSFKNYLELEDHVNYESELEFIEHERNMDIPESAKESIYELISMAANCKEDAEDTRIKINRLGRDHESAIKSEINLMKEKYQESIDKIINASKETIAKQAKELEEKTALLEKNKALLADTEEELKVLKSDEYKKNIGETFFTSLIDDYIKPYEDSDDQSTRLRIYNELWNFVSGTNGVPKDIKERVKRFRLPIKKKQVPTTVVNIKELNGTALGSANQSFGDNTPKLES